MTSPTGPASAPRRPKETITSEHYECAELIVRTFRPRPDVYAIRYDDEDTVASFNRWRETKPERERAAIQPARIGAWKPVRKNRGFVPITVDEVARHVAGYVTLGFYPMHLDGTCNSVSVDFDNHQGEKVVERDPRVDYDLVAAVLQQAGARFLGQHSRGGGGCWAHILPPMSQKAREARALVDAVIRRSGVKGIRDGGTYDDMFPKQDAPRLKPDGTPSGDPGNLFCLPCSMRWMGAATPGSHFIGTDPRSLAEQISYLKEY